MSFSTAWPDAKGRWVGRNWAVFVGITGPIQAETGMIMELSQLKSIMINRVLPEVDHWDLVEQWGYQPTLIEWGGWWWDQLSSVLPNGQLNHIYIDSGQEGVMVQQGQVGSFIWTSYEVPTPMVPLEVRVRLQEGAGLTTFPMGGTLLDWARYGASMTQSGRVASGKWGWEWQNQAVYHECWGECVAGHQLYRSYLSAQQNQNLFGKCVRRHGHTFLLGVTVPVGQTIPPVWEESEWMGGLTTAGMTLEQLAMAIMNRYDTIVRLRIHETEGNRVSIRRMGVLNEPKGVIA